MYKQVYFLFLTAFIIISVLPAQAQEDAAAAEEEVKEGWETGAGMGLDFSQLFQLNPRQGAGQNRLGIGGAINFFANYRKDRVAWDNITNWQFGVQRLGAGVIAQGTTQKKIPFQKAIDELRLNSKWGYKTSNTSKFFYAADFSFTSQLTPTYLGNDDYPGNFISDFANNGANSKLFAPATINFSLGMDYKPIENLSIYYSPVGLKMIIVADNAIAALNVHGNEEGKNSFVGLGSVLRMGYTAKYLNDRMAYTSGLLLFSNYLENPQNIDVDWTNEFAFTIVKGFQAALTLNLLYDDDILVQVTDLDAPNGVSGLGKRVSITQQFLLKYNIVF